MKPRRTLKGTEDCFFRRKGDDEDAGKERAHQGDQRRARLSMEREVAGLGAGGSHLPLVKLVGVSKRALPAKFNITLQVHAEALLPAHSLPRSLVPLPPCPPLPTPLSTAAHQTVHPILQALK